MPEPEFLLTTEERDDAWYKASEEGVGLDVAVARAQAVKIGLWLMDGDRARVLGLRNWALGQRDQHGRDKRPPRRAQGGSGSDGLS